MTEHEQSVDIPNPEPSRGVQELGEHQFKDHLDAILSTPLMPETIDTYASSALDKLVDLAEEATHAYSLFSGITFETKREAETAAFNFFRLGDIELILDHISEKATELDHLDVIISAASRTDQIIVPPDSDAPRTIVEGNGTYREKRLVPRLKTTLFILSNSFEVNLDDLSQLRLHTGDVSDNMVRNTSYVAIEAITIGRTVLVCDEENNASYVFNSKVLEEQGVSVDALMVMSKSELAQLVADNPKAGRQIIYSEHFVPNMVHALEDPETQPRRQRSESPEDQYLLPKPPEGVVSMQRLANIFGVDRSTISKTVDSLRGTDDFGDISEYSFGTHPTVGLTEQQQQMVLDDLEARSVLVGKPPEGYSSLVALSREFGVAEQSVIREFERLSELGMIGETQLFRFGSKPTAGLSPEQQQLIRKGLEEKGLFLPLPPEGTLSRAGLADQLGISVASVYKAIDELVESGRIQDLTRYRFGPHAHVGLDSEQQQMVTSYLVEQGTVAPPAPEGVLSTRGLAGLFGLERATIGRAIDELLAVDALGSVGYFKFGGGKAVAGFTEQQREIIEKHLKERGLFSLQAPEGTKRFDDLATELDVSRGALRYTIKSLLEQGVIAPIEIYKFGKSRARGLDAEQQRAVRQALEERGTLAPRAPEGILSIAGIAEVVGVAHYVVDETVTELDESEALGERSRFRFGSNISFGFDAEQQKRIIEHIRENRPS